MQDMKHVLRRRAVLCLSLVGLLSACAPSRHSGTPQTALRDGSAPVASQSDVSLARLQGDWRIVQAADIAAGTGVSVTATTFTMGATTDPISEIGQGRFRIGDGEIWVHWMDIDSRTAALGDLAGNRVWIMDRTGSPGERLLAARKILDWYGYDLTRLQ